MYPSTTSPYSGNITAQNVADPNGPNVTVGSTVTLPLNRGAFDTAAIQVTGTYTGILTVQVTIDGTNWISLAAATSLINMATAAQSATIASAAVGMWQLDVSSCVGVRVTALAAVTGTAVVTLVAGSGNGVVGIDTPITIAAGQSVTTTPATPSSSN